MDHGRLLARGSTHTPSILLFFSLYEVLGTGSGSEIRDGKIRIRDSQHNSDFAYFQQIVISFAFMLDIPVTI
jgi:hypothetical protein